MSILVILTILNSLLIGFLLFVTRFNVLSLRNNINTKHTICCERTEYNHKNIEQLQDRVQALEGDVKNIIAQIPNYDPLYTLNKIFKH